MTLKRYQKSPKAIALMREACRLAADVLVMIEPYVQPGTTTAELNERCHDYMVNTLNVIPAPLDYRGFPKSICTSINHVICHGIPNEKPLKEGDILNIDVTVIHEGYHGDTSRMFAVGKPSIKAQRLMDISQQALYLGIQMVKPGASLKAIGRAIEQFALKHRFTSVHEYCGHGIGLDFHESGFQVLHYHERSGQDQILLPGLTFTIEPMINAGKRHVRLHDDGWTVTTKDRSLSSQWEHTLLVTESGVEVLTLRPCEHIPQITNHPIKD